MIPSGLINSLVSRADGGPLRPGVKAHGGYSGAGHLAVTARRRRAAGRCGTGRGM